MRALADMVATRRGGFGTLVHSDQTGAPPTSCGREALSQMRPPRDSAKTSNLCRSEEQVTTSTGKRRPPTSRQPDQLVPRTRDLQKTPLATLIRARSLPLLQAAIAVALRSPGPGMAGPKEWANPSRQRPPATSRMDSSGFPDPALPEGPAEMATSATAGRKAGSGCMGAQFP